MPEARRTKPAPGMGWGDVKRGFGFGVGFLLGVCIVLFALAAIYLLLGHRPWMDRILGWLERLFA